MEKLSTENEPNASPTIAQSNDNDKNTGDMIWNLTIFDQLRISRFFRELSENKTHITLDQLEKCYDFKDVELIDIWCLCNPLCTNILTRDQFTVFSWLLQEKEKGIPLPASLCNIPKMPERYSEAVKCKKLNKSEFVEKETHIENALKNAQTKFDRLSEAMMQHKKQCHETKKILEALKCQAENMLRSLYKREIRITTEQIENDAISPKLQYAKEEIISLQQECSTNVCAIQTKFDELKVVENEVDHLIDEAEDLNHGIIDEKFDEIQKSLTNESQFEGFFFPSHENNFFDDQLLLLDSDVEE